MKAILIFALLLSTLLQAQDVNLKWANRIGGTTEIDANGIANGTSVAVDASGNVYTAGNFNGTVDLDPGTGTFYFTGCGMYILKLGPSGNFVWAKQIQGTNIWGSLNISITLDGFGSILCVGQFGGSIFFDPGNSNLTLTADPSFAFGMGFISKLDTAGNVMWAKKFGRTDLDAETPYSVKTDATGNIYISGSFSDSADLDPGPGIFYLFGPSAGESHDTGEYRIFISKLDSSGNFLWAKAPQKVEANLMGISGAGLFVDASGNIFFTGSFSGTIDFDPGPGEFIVSNCSPGCMNGTDIFVWKLDVDGNFNWVKVIGKMDSYEEGGGGSGLVVDVFGNIYSIGTFKGTLDFDPGPGVFNLSSSIGQANKYVLKLDSAGNFIWAKKEDGYPLYFSSLASDTLSNIYVTGWFAGTVDFDLGPGIYNLTDTGFNDKFIFSLNSNGNFLWAVKTTGADTSGCNGISITTDVSGNVYTTGYFRGTVDFDPGLNVNSLTSVGQPNMFVDKLDTAGNFKWARRVGGTTSATGIVNVRAIAIDLAGNVYTTGSYAGSVDFDPGPGTYLMTGGWSFILKLDSSGNFVWAKQITAGSHSITLDAFGGIYIVGDFLGNVDFDPGPFNFTLSSNFQMCFSVKLDTNGNFIWAKKFGRSDSDADTDYDVKTDASGNVYISGAFADTADFDPGPGVFYLYGIQAGWSYISAEYRIFITKLDSAGNFLWAKAPKEVQTGFESIRGTHLFVDDAGNVYYTGDFEGELDFDPGPNVFILDGGSIGMDYSDIYILKLSAEGDFLWAKKMSGSQGSNGNRAGQGEGIAVDPTGNVYSIGIFEGTFDFDPGPGVFNLSSPPYHYISKLDSAGNFVWAKKMEPSPGLIFSGFSTIALDIFSNIYLTGFFRNTVDFDMGPGVFNLMGTSIADKFVSRLNADGELIWVRRTTGTDTSYTYVQSIAIDSYGNIFTTGKFRSTVNFDPGTNVYNLTSAGPQNMFVDKLSNCANSAIILTQPLNQQTCPGTSAAFSVSASGAIAYQWQLSTDEGITYSDINTANGTSYTITSVASNQNNYRYRCRVTGGCNTIISSSALLTIISTTLTVQPQSASLCAGNDHTFSVTAPGASAYQWQLSIDGGITFEDITGATNSSYSLTSVTTQQNGYQYRCIVSNTCDSLTSSVAELLVIDPVSMVSQPANTEICSGGNTNFSVSGTSTQVIFYQWEVSTDGGTNYSTALNGGTYSGTTTSVLVITGADASLNNNRYRCKLSNAICGNATVSNAAMLTVRRLPSIALAAFPVTSLFPWQTTTLTATSAGTGGDLSFNWYYNNMVVPNRGNSRMVNFNQLGNYQVQVSERWPSDLVCTNRSAIVAITANDTAKLIIYPNPNYGQFRISYYNPSGVHDLQVITIYDSKGAMVYRKRLTPAGIYTLVDISMIPGTSGFYSVIVSNEKGKRLAIGKVIVQ